MRGHADLDRGRPTSGIAVRQTWIAGTTEGRLATSMLSVPAVGVTSAGSQPRELIHPIAIRVLGQDYGIDIAGQQPRHLDSTTARRFDYVVTLCDKVREVCPEFPGHPRHIHWSVPDPVSARAREAEASVRRTAQDIDTRVGHLLHVLAMT